MRIRCSALVIVVTAWAASTDSIVSTAWADDASDARALLQRWTDAQLKGDLATYSGFYAKKFFGVRRSGSRVEHFDHDGWLKDRGRMFKKPMRVETSDVRVTPAEGGVELDFTQRFTEGTFHDEGPKVMTLAREYGAFVITSERMLESKATGVVGQPNDAWRGAIGAVTAEGLVLPWIVDTTFASGPAKRHVDKQGREVGRHVGNDKVPAAARALLGNNVEIIADDGTRRTAKVTGLSIVTVVDHTVERNGEVGIFDRHDDPPMPARLVAEIDPKSALQHGLVARAAGSTAPIVVAKKADAATVSAALKQIRALSAAQNVGKVTDKAVRTLDVTIDGKPRRLVSVVIANDGGCADGADLWALYSVEGKEWKLMSVPSTFTIVPKIAVDLDGDGWPELLSNGPAGYDDLGFDLEVEIIRRWRELYQTYDKIRTDYLGCPC